MITSSSFQYPKDEDQAFAKARKLEWLTMGYQLSKIILIYLVMGSSQALKSAWIEEMLSLVPPVSFLVAAQFYKKKPNDRFPYGYHRVFQIAHLAGSLGILLMGVLMVLDATRSLITGQHPTLASVTLFGHSFWIGWLAIIVLLYKALPAYFLGKRKLQLAKLTEDEILHTGAIAQKLSYHTALAAAAGILGIGMGWWWADEAAAYFISYTIFRQGLKSVSTAMINLMDSYPIGEMKDKLDEDIQNVLSEVKACEWVEDAGIRARAQGHVLFGEIWVVPRTQEGLLENIGKIREHILSGYWRVQDVVIAPVKKLPEE